MTPDPQTVEPDKPLGYALHMMYEGGFRNVPVVEKGRLMGIVSARNALGPELKQFVYDYYSQQNHSRVAENQGMAKAGAAK